MGKKAKKKSEKKKLKATKAEKNLEKIGKKASKAKKKKLKTQKHTAETSFRPPINHQNRNQMTQVAAYYIAEKRGFLPDRSLDDWLQAERQIDRILGISE